MYYALPVGPVLEPPNLEVAERLCLWGKGFENSSKPLPLRIKRSPGLVFPTSLGLLGRSPGSPRDLSCLVISPAGTLQPLL